MIVLGILGDGRREYLAETVASAHENLGRFDAQFIVDDTGDPDYHDELRAKYPQFEIVGHTPKLGMAGAVNHVWSHALSLDADYLFDLEEDWVFNGPVDVESMRALLDTHPQLAEVALKRSAELNNPDEVKTMNFMRVFPDRYTERDGWTESTQLFTLNPCLIPRRTLELGWPSGPIGIGNEDGMTQRCLDAGMTFGFLGGIDGPDRVQHIGAGRSEDWML